ncbi:MAG TPA: ParB N-terminal domain-containing protein [Pirellulales bacterium]
MSSELNHATLLISRIRLDGGTQIREKLDDDVVREYAERMREGVVFPRPFVIYDGENYWLADGFHRLHAALLLERTTIDCRIVSGTRRDAIMAAIQANATHGLRRTNADKRRAVVAILADREWSLKSNRWIANTCGVGRDMVEAVRRQLSETANSPQGGVSEARLGQDGKLRPAHRTAQSADAPFLDPIESALHCAAAFDVCLKRLRQVATEGERLAAGPGGSFLSGRRMDDFRQCVSLAAQTLDAARPSQRCGTCGGAGCDDCQNVGWLCPAVQPLI